MGIRRLASRLESGRIVDVLGGTPRFPNWRETCHAYLLMKIDLAE